MNRAETVARLRDVIVAALGLLLLAPLLLILALVVAIGLGRPVIFRQTRPGLHGRPFDLLKFRTMTEARAKDGTLLPDAVRLTRLGRLLRATSVDELPSLWNVLRGDLSLVGPRPLLMQYLPLYSPHQARRMEVRPGITGWAQINGRNSLSWPDKFELDIWYVDNRGIALDFKILWLTAVKVLRREGISADNEATMPMFTGNDPH